MANNHVLQWRIHVWWLNHKLNVGHHCGYKMHDTFKKKISLKIIFYAPFKAHCVEGRSSVLSSFSIGLGYWDRQNVNSWSVLKKVTRIIIHPSYNTNTLANDIALMKLDVSFKNTLTVYSRFSFY
jgi:hypothetical protein